MLMNLNSIEANESIKLAIARFSISPVVSQAKSFYLACSDNHPISC